MSLLLLKRKVSIFITLILFLANGFMPLIASAAILPYMPPPGQMIFVTQNFDYAYPVAMKFDPEDIFHLTFVFNRANSPAQEAPLRAEAERVARYFLAALTVPADDLWVNLAPDAPEDVIPEALAKTDMGKDLLGEDYVLKQLSASLTHPDSEVGKKYWQAIDSARGAQSLQNVWVIPGQIALKEYQNQVVITKAELEVLTYQDYVDKGKAGKGDARDDANMEAFKRYILPILNKEVNGGKHFTYLRQIYRAIILAGWFQVKMENTALSQVYFDKNKVAGAGDGSMKAKQAIYDEYVGAFKTGVYNVSRVDTAGGRTKKRTYFSGGGDFSGAKRAGRPDTADGSGGSTTVAASVTSLVDAMMLATNVINQQGPQPGAVAAEVEITDLDIVEEENGPTEQELKDVAWVEEKFAMLNEAGEIKEGQADRCMKWLMRLLKDWRENRGKTLDIDEASSERVRNQVIDIEKDDLAKMPIELPDDIIKAVWYAHNHYGGALSYDDTNEVGGFYYRTRDLSQTEKDNFEKKRDRMSRVIKPFVGNDVNVTILMTHWFMDRRYAGIAADEPVDGPEPWQSNISTARERPMLRVLPGGRADTMADIVSTPASDAEYDFDVDFDREYARKDAENYLDNIGKVNFTDKEWLSAGVNERNLDKYKKDFAYGKVLLQVGLSNEERKRLIEALIDGHMKPGKISDAAALRERDKEPWQRRFTAADFVPDGNGDAPTQRLAKFMAAQPVAKYIANTSAAYKDKLDMHGKIIDGILAVIYGAGITGIMGIQHKKGTKPKDGVGGFDMSRTRKKASIQTIGGGAKIPVSQVSAYLSGKKIPGFKAVVESVKY